MKKYGLMLLLTVFLGIMGVTQVQAAETVVVKGTFDSIEKILDSLGWSYELITASDFMTRDLSGVRQLYINCGSGSTDQLKTKVKDYVEAGGNLYASDWASDYVEAWGLTFEKDGNGGMVTATIEDPGLKSYLNESTIEIEYDLGTWCVITDPAAAGILLRGDVNGGSITNSPLAVTFNAGKGRVVYTTFHNEHDGITQPGMKKAVEYFAINPKTNTEVDALLAEYNLSPKDLVGSSANSLSAAQNDGISVTGIAAGTSGSYLFKITNSTLGVASAGLIKTANSCEVELYKPDGTLYKTETLAGNSTAVDVPASDNDAGAWKFKVKQASGYSANAMVVAASCKGTAGSGGGSTTVLPTKIDFSIAGSQIKVGASKNILVTFTPADTTERDLTWTVGNDLIAKVEKAGTDMYKVTGLLKGSTTLTATSKAVSSVSKTVDITIVDTGNSGGGGSETDRDSSGGCDGIGLGMLALIALAGLKPRRN